jgi:hypothetical protein
MTLIMCARLMLALATLQRITPTGPRREAPAQRIAADSAATVQILEELRGYYRDLHDRNWTSMVTHFYPAKVTARFAVPDRDSAWVALQVPPLAPRESPDVHGYCVPGTAIAIVGNWARVRARRCSGEADELWFYSMSGRWKIIHLESGAALTTAAEQAK